MTFRAHRICMLLVVAAVSVAPAQVTRVSSAAEIATALQTAQPGDTLLMTNGIWTDQLITFQGLGSASAPIVLKAETNGQVELTGTSRLRISGQYLVVDGLRFRSGYSPSGAVIEFRNGSGIAATDCRLTNTSIEDYNPPSTATDYKWVSMYGFRNTVEYCYFAGKTHAGTTFVVWLSDQPNAHWVHHNFFGRRPPLGVNGGETIRVGTSDWSMYNSRTVVESNYFLECDGEAEIISSKSCENVYRANVFVRCEGALTLRHGNRNRVEGNFFFGEGTSNTGGIRVIGEDQVVINNYLVGLTGSAPRAPLTLMNGIPSSPLNGYFQVQRAQIAFNTFVNTRNTIVIGYGKSDSISLPPLDCTIANNIVRSPNSPFIALVDTPISMIYEGNIMYGGFVGISDTGIHVIDPQLVLSPDGLWRPAATSPVLGAASGSYGSVTEDMDGDPRSGSKDVGADQFSTEPPVRHPVTQNDVGPDWMRNTTEVAQATLQAPEGYALSDCYPNPFNGQTGFAVTCPKSGELTVEVFDIRGRRLSEVNLGWREAGTHRMVWRPEALPSGLYVLRVSSQAWSSSIKALYLK